jgi:hypothetical protein
MEEKIICIEPKNLHGPRSFFTDLDPRDPDYNPADVTRKLKLQLITKDKILIAASSLFHKVGYDMFSKDPGLIRCLETGIIIPTIRDQFSSIKDFFDAKKEGYPEESKNFFISHVKFNVPWSLHENTSWFKNKIYSHMLDKSSLLRSKLSLSDEMVNKFINLLDKKIKEADVNERFLRREYIDEIGEQFGTEVNRYINNYANLIYRISGARVVNSEGHFPQSNLTKLKVTDSDKIISDESIFWDIYVEAVIMFLTSVVKLNPQRLDRLSFLDILKIRKSIFERDFSKEYDELISLAKSKIHIDDPEKLILKQEEIITVAEKIREYFKDRVEFEFKKRKDGSRSEGLWQITNILALISGQMQTNLIIGILSSLKSLPEITALISKSLSDAVKERMEWMENFINSRTSWSKKQRKILLNGYMKLVTYGWES